MGGGWGGARDKSQRGLRPWEPLLLLFLWSVWEALLLKWSTWPLQNAHGGKKYAREGRQEKLSGGGGQSTYSTTVYLKGLEIKSVWMKRSSPELFSQTSSTLLRSICGAEYPACLLAEGGSRREPTKARGRTCKLYLNPLPSCCELTLLTTKPLYHYSLIISIRLLRIINQWSDPTSL